jgi:hypothetical protein
MGQQRGIRGLKNVITRFMDRYVNISEESIIAHFMDSSLQDQEHDNPVLEAGKA